MKRRLTMKQKMFVAEYVKSKGNETQSALKVYDTTDKITAGAIATENLNKPNVHEELNRILTREELSLNTFTSKLSDIVQSEPAKGYSGADIMDAVKTGLKLHGVLQDRKTVTSYNLTADLAKLSKYELIELHKRKQQETDQILQGE